jgi:hypothetical protein
LNRVIAISAASMFEFDKAELNEDGKAVIDDAIKILGPELTDAYLILVVGHIQILRVMRVITRRYRSSELRVWLITSYLLESKRMQNECPPLKAVIPC